MPQNLHIPEEVKSSVDIRVDELEKRVLLQFSGMAEDLKEVTAQLKEITTDLKVITVERGTFLRMNDYLTAHQALAQRVEKLEQWKSWVMGIGAAVSMASGAVGAFIVHLLR